jgi:hypothetical protein
MLMRIMIVSTKRYRRDAKQWRCMPVNSPPFAAGHMQSYCMIIVQASLSEDHPLGALHHQPIDSVSLLYAAEIARTLAISDVVGVLNFFALRHAVFAH